MYDEYINLISNFLIFFSLIFFFILITIHINKKFNLKINLLLFLFFWHLMFAFLYYFYTLFYIADATTYYFRAVNSDSPFFSTIIGPDFILNIIYVLTKLTNINYLNTYLIFNYIG